jgi:signal transduction histidine kinase
MAYRILVIDTARKRAGAWKARLSSLHDALVGPFQSPSRLSAAELGAIDLVILDGASLRRGGTDLVGGLREHCEASAPPVIVTVAPGAAAERAAAIALGCDEILEEPVATQMLVICVKYLLHVKAARDELLRGSRESARARDERRILAESLVHDLKNPIAVVHVNLSWALEQIGSDWPEIAEALADAQGGLVALRQLVDDLLMVGMLEQSKLPLKREDIRVTDLFDDAIKWHEREARARNVSLTLSLEEDVRVVGDSAVLRRAMRNLLETSLRHTPSSGKIALSARSGPAHAHDSANDEPATAAEGSQVEIAVSSSGRPFAPGAPPPGAVRGQTPPAAPRLPSGSLALYFCRRAVEAHAGEFDVIESDEGPSSVVMRLPATG